MLSVLSQAWRCWAGAKGVAVLATVALAVGIGSTTAIYTVVNAVMLKPLPYKDGERYVALFGATINDPKSRSSLTYPDLLEYQQRTQSFDAFGWFRLGNYNLTSPGDPQHIYGVAVTASLVNNLGVNPMIGRWFADPANEPGGLNVAVISSALWRRIGADPNIAGKAVTLNGRSYTVAGVMPPGFRLPLRGPGVEGVSSDVWVSLDPLGRGQNAKEGAFFCYARRKPSVPFAQANADVRRVAAEIAAKDPIGHPAYTAKLDDLKEIVVDQVRPTLLLLFGAAALLLLITCANVAGLLVTRSVERARDTALRVALGAPRRRLALQYFTEGLLVSLAGAAGGVFVSIALVRVVVSIAAQFIPRADEIAIDWRVLVFAIVSACIASALSSMAPLWQAVRTAPSEALREGTRSSAGVRSSGLTQALVVAEIGLAFTLLSVSAVMIDHLGNLTHVWPGFDPQRLLTFDLTLADSIVADQGKRIPYQLRLTAAMESIPGVSGAAFVNQLPLAGCCFSTTIFPEGRPANPDAALRTSFLIASPGYLRTMRIPLKRGRLLNEHDASGELLKVVINQTAANQNWPNQDPIGAYGRFLGPTGSRFQVVGVVGDVRNDGLGKPPVAEVYLLSFVAAANPMHFVVRSALPADKLVPEVRRALQGVDATLPVHDIAPMEEIIRNSVTLERVGSFMMGFFAGAALLMATLGIYGVVSYSVRRRAVEIGTRMALGAERRDLFSLVVGGGLKMAAFGIAIGGLGAMGAIWTLMRVFEIHQLGWIPFVYATSIVVGVAIGGSLFPAWRATLLSPMVAIRNEPESMWVSARRGMRRALKGISEAISGPDEDRMSADGTLLMEFAGAARAAASFPEAIQTALTALRERIGAEWAMLLEKAGTDEYRVSAVVPEGDPSCVSLPSQGYLVNRLRSHTYPLPVNQGDFDAWLRWAEEFRPGYAAEISELRKTGVQLAAALRTKGEILGLLLLGSPTAREEYSWGERQALRTCADQLALMMENARLTVRVVEQEKLRLDLAMAAEVQRRLLPEHPPEIAVAALAAMSLPARTIGGDYYDFVRIGDHRIGIALADVAGKGVAAALIMSVVQASLRILASDGELSLPQLAARMNRFLHRSTKSNSYATFFYAQIDEDSRQMRYVNAGHNPPYLLRPDGNPGAEIHELSVGGTVLGLFPQMSYEEATVELRKGDVLIAFTDGVTEALSPAEEEFGEDRLKDLLRQCVDLPAQEISSRIGEALKGWIKDAAQFDDLTFVVVKVN